MENHSFRTKPIFVGFLLCIFSTSAFTLGMILYHQTINAYLRRSSDEMDIPFFIEEIRANSYAAQMIIMRYRETNNPESANNFQKHIDEIHRIGSDVSSTHAPNAEEMRKEIENLIRQMEDLLGFLSEDVHVGELLAREETQKLLAVRKEVRNRQNQSIDEIETRLNILMSTQQDLHVKNWQRIVSFHSHLTSMLILSSVFVVMFNVIVFVTVIRLVSRNVAPSDWDGVSLPGTSQNLRVVADQLQEIVNSLRR